MNFDTLQELEEKVASLDIERANSVLAAKLGEFMRPEPRSLKPTVDGICSFHASGMLEFIRRPKHKVQILALTLYAYQPDALTTRVLSEATGVTNPTAFLASHRYEKYFRKQGRASYGLSHEGARWVTDTVLPSIQQSRGEGGAE